MEESSGIQSRTLASWSRGWENDRGTIGRGDVFVIDEAGMVGSRQLARFVTEAEARGAKIVLVGDHEQLQAIGAGAPFRAITEEIGHAELSEIRRQRVDWQREASVAFATHRTAEGLAAYRDRGDIRFSESGEGARGEIVRDYLADRDERPDGARVAMAHRRVDVRAINDAIRTELQDRGELARGNVPAVGSDAGALTFQTNDGAREFAPGDRIVFLENNRDLGVKNGMLGTVEHVEAGRIVAQLDGRDGESVSVPMGDYQAVDHGYATTIHKNQGATVDRAYVLASGTMDRHLTYVAMTRHRDGVQLYAGQDEFSKSDLGRQAGRLVEHGAAPFEHQAGNGDSYFVTLENGKGERHTTWGVGLEKAMKDAAPEIGATIGLQHMGSTPVTLPDGTETHRNTWQVRDAGELAYSQLENRLSRSGAKETTLDYTRDFAERRGIAEHMGVRSEIEIPAERAGLRAERVSTAERSPLAAEVRREGPHQEAERGVAAEAMPEVAADRPRRGMFEGLKLSREPSPATKHPEQDRTTLAKAGQEKALQPRRGMFEGLRLYVGPNAGRGREEMSPALQPDRKEGVRATLADETPERDRLAERLRTPSAFEAAVDRYAQVYSALDRHLSQGLPFLEGQKQELAAAGQQLDQARPDACDLMLSALRHDPDTRQAMALLSGRERVDQLTAGMEREQAALADPRVRADRFVERWQELKREHDNLYGWQHEAARGKVEGEMRALGKSLERDPQVDSLLRDRGQELGIGYVRRDVSLTQELEHSLARGHSLGLGM